MNNISKENECSYLEELIKISPFGNYGKKLNLIASVGNNGNYNQRDIFEGYCSATMCMIESIKNNSYYADTMVYPILFCVRHSIELYLKMLYFDFRNINLIKKNSKQYFRQVKVQILYQTIVEKQDDLCIAEKKLQLEDGKRNKLNKNLKYQGILNQRLTAVKKIMEDEGNLCCTLAKKIYAHDIGILMDMVLKENIFDSRIQNKIDVFMEIASFYSEIDPHGDAFRYLIDKSDKPFFESKKIQIVDLEIVENHLKKIMQTSKQIDKVNSLIFQEYQTQTFTNKLSRFQIEEISKLLPAKELFNEQIKTKKKIITEQYNISNREFDRVVKIIRSNREFSANLGCEILFLQLSDTAIHLFARCALDMSNWSSSFEIMSKDELVLLYSFSKMSLRYSEDARFIYFSEELNSLYYRIKRKRDISCNEINPQKDFVDIVDGMRRCGQITYAKKMEEAYKKFSTSIPCSSSVK